MKLVQAIVAFLVLSLYAGTGCQPTIRKISKEKLKGIDEAVNEEIEKGSFPGAVVLVAQADEILYRQAFGHKLITPRTEAMSKNTVFDIASLTKPVATAPSIMILRDRGKLRLSDYAGKYLPAFACEGKEKVQIEHLLTHTSGLPAYMSASELKGQFGSPCPDKVIDKICSLKALSEPGEEFRYSCLGYMTLAKIAEVVSGREIDEFATENIFEPLGMEHTTYNPPESWSKNTAATQIVEGRPLRGVVHDPLARLMGGITGNAGVFSTARDLSIYCQMLLNGGKWKGRTILSPESVGLLTKVVSHGRACGFDVNSSYSWIKGSFAPQEAFCHSGYTGTSIVCDPASKVYVIILTNRTHPDDTGTSRPVRTKVADIVFQELGEGR
ncbi:MAG: beta-lactamase family protein [Planctomycetes bacterium]|nr:beta-lactamase family protein [Planctomycetota bacterium]